MFKVVYSRHGKLHVGQHESYDEAVHDQQGGDEFGEAYGHGVYDVERGVAFYPHRIGEEGRFDPHNERALMKALGLESPPVVAGLYSRFYEESAEENEL